MLRDLVLELVSAPGSGATITLPGSAPVGRRTWAAGFVSSQPAVFYILDDSLQQEWGVGVLSIGAPSTITRPTVVLGNSAGTTARLNFTDTCRCYSQMPSAAMLQAVSAPVGRNQIHNAQFGIQQRGAGPFTANGAMTLDRWSLGRSIDTASVTAVALSDANRASLADDSAAFGLSNTFASSGAVGSYNVVTQRIENVRRLANQTVSVSFAAWATAGTPKLGVSIDQTFGSGGSPSAIVSGNGSAVTLSTTPKRYYLTFTIPSVSGKTLGSNNDHLTELLFWFSAGSTNAARAGGVGVQSGTIVITGVQLEVGSVPTPLEKTGIGDDLLNCMRFYQTGTAQLYGYGVATQLVAVATPLLVPMRAAPTIVPTWTLTNISSNALGATAVNLTLSGNVVATANFALQAAYTASADL